MNTDVAAMAYQVGRYQQLLGYTVYAVGGCVRDALMLRPCDDIDLTTAAHPDQIESALRQAGVCTFGLGKCFGTIAFTDPLRIPQQVEVTTFRTEVYADGSRKPDVQFADSLQADLSRRDFTINAIAVDAQGTVYDTHQGQADLAGRIVRAVGNPIQRFQEDPLRMLRAVRLAGKLHFDIERATWQAIYHQRYRLGSVSRERWSAELDKIMLQQNPRHALELLQLSGILGIVLPWMQAQVGFQQCTPWHDFELWEHTVRVVCNVPATPANMHLRWAALLHDIAKPFVEVHQSDTGQSHYHGHAQVGAGMVEDVGRRLRWSKKRTTIITEIVATHLQSDSVLKPYDDAAKKV